MATKGKQIADQRQFVASPAIIYSLIRAQAGSLAKAVLECVMNSVDAGAKNVEIVLSAKRLKVTDDGKGFTSLAEIEQCFEVFGFEHVEGERVYGQFGIGRAQLWNFCSTVWRTHGFEMDVDIKRKGLDYGLRSNCEELSGLVITGELYEPMSQSDLLAFNRELTDLCAYVPATVTLNGKPISRNPTDEKWTHETDDAWIRLKEGAELAVFNMGVKVRTYQSYQVGVGGLVVTKPGVRLALNMARNDILQSECQVWKRIKPFLQKQADERIKKSTRLSEEEIQNVCHRFMSGELSFDAFKGYRVVQSVEGRSYTLTKFLDSRETRGLRIFAGTKDDHRALKIHGQQDAFVISELTLQRFGCETVPELGEGLAERWGSDPRYGVGEPSEYQWLDESAAADILAEVKSDCENIKWLSHTKEEQALCGALQHSALTNLRQVIHREMGESCGKAMGNIILGKSSSLLAWTNGVDKIVLQQEHALRMARMGLPGFIALAHLVLHEALHDSESQGSHVHDHEFYARFERITTNNGSSRRFGEFVIAAYTHFIRRLKASGQALTKGKLEGADLLDSDEFEPTDVDFEDSKELLAA